MDFVELFKKVEKVEDGDNIGRFWPTSGINDVEANWLWQNKAINGTPDGERSFHNGRLVKGKALLAIKGHLQAMQRHNAPQTRGVNLDSLEARL